MAKKKSRKAVKKKAVKKKAVKKKAAKKTVARRKPVKAKRGKATKGPGPVIAAGSQSKEVPGDAPRRIKFHCSGGCRATPPPPHHIGGPGSIVVLEAVNTGVTIDFKENGSPFDPPTDPIVMVAGESRTEVVADDASGHYRYDFTCTECAPPPGPHVKTPPEMIVP